MRIKPPAPLFRDPICDGAADPTIIYTEEEKCYTIIYTNRRANVTAPGWSWVMGCDIGIAQSVDGKNWQYRGIVPNLNFEQGHNTFWAPEIIKHNGTYHMFCSYISGISATGNGKRSMVHYVGKSIWELKFVGVMTVFGDDNVIDATVHRIDNGKWRMWVKNETKGSITVAAESDNLIDWKYSGEIITDTPHEGANVFYFKNYYWMIIDEWKGQGVYRSKDGIVFEKRPCRILDKPGNRIDDEAIGNHADVLVENDKAFIFYFTHPQLAQQDAIADWQYNSKRTVLQVAEIEFDQENQEIFCDRNKDGEFLELTMLNNN